MNELYHYGVKGMKWGIRKDKKEVSKSTNFTLSDKQKKYIGIGIGLCASVAFSYVWSTKLHSITTHKMYRAVNSNIDWDALIENSGPEIVRRL